VISVTSFASNYTSLWRSLTPTMEEFVRRTNMHGVRHWTPLTSNVEQGRRALANEAAFALFAETIRGVGRERTRSLDDRVTDAFATASKFVSGSDSSAISEPTVAERSDAIELSRRLFIYFAPRRQGLEIAPSFKGCGIIRKSVGDVLTADEGLFEIKAGDRAFRSIDFRQIAIYCGLHFAETGEILRQLHLVNPRTGVTFGVGTDDFCHAVAGVPATTFCQNLVASFSASMISD
jgi:hypothetical protein